MTDEQLRRVVNYLNIQVSDRVGKIKRVGGIETSRPQIYDRADIERMGTRELMQAIQSGRQFLSQPILVVPHTPIRDRVIQELYDLYEGHISLQYIAILVNQVYEDGMKFEEIVRRAGEIIERQHPEFSGRALSLITFYEVM